MEVIIIILTIGHQSIKTKMSVVDEDGAQCLHDFGDFSRREKIDNSYDDDEETSSAAPLE